MREFQGCPGSQMLNFNPKVQKDAEIPVGEIQSQLRQWPIQLHLVSPTAPYYQGADVQSLTAVRKSTWKKLNPGSMTPKSIHSPF